MIDSNRSRTATAAILMRLFIIITISAASFSAPTGTPKEKLRWTFKLYDINGDGRITRDEMMDIIYSVYSLNADRERADGADNDDKHSNNIEAPQLHANRVFQVREHKTIHLFIRKIYDHDSSRSNEVPLIVLNYILDLKCISFLFSPVFTMAVTVEAH